MLVILVHLKNAEFPILVKLSGRVMLVILVQSSKARSSILVTEYSSILEGITILISLPTYFVILILSFIIKYCRPLDSNTSVTPQ